MSVGEQLSTARRAAGLTMADVSESTRIRAGLIQAIEADDFAGCGGDVYARGHIRSIARSVGVDPTPLIAEFDATHADEAPPVLATVAPQATDARSVARAERRRPNWGAAMAAALVVVCVVAGYGIVHHSGGGSSRSTAGSSHHVTATTTPPAGRSSSSPPPSSVAQIPADKATMLVRASKGQTWLSVETSSGAVLYQGLLASGQQKLFTNKHGLTFVIGNAPAVDLVVNGHDIGAPKASGSVSRGTVSPGADSVTLA